MFYEVEGTFRKNLMRTEELLNWSLFYGLRNVYGPSKVGLIDDPNWAFIDQLSERLLRRTGDFINELKSVFVGVLKGIWREFSGRTKGSFSKRTGGRLSRLNGGNSYKRVKGNLSRRPDRVLLHEPKHVFQHKLKDVLLPALEGVCLDELGCLPREVGRSLSSKISRIEFFEKNLRESFRPAEGCLSDKLKEDFLD